MILIVQSLSYPLNQFLWFLGVKTKYLKKTSKEMTGVYARSINQYKFNFHTLFSAALIRLMKKIRDVMNFIYLITWILIKISQNLMILTLTINLNYTSTIVIRSMNWLNKMIMMCYQKIVILVKILVLEICNPNITGRSEHFSLVCDSFSWNNI